MNMSDRNGSKLHPSAGARFHRCAFQVNPHSYAGKYRGQTSPLDAAEYVTALVAKAKALHIAVLAVTDHNHVGGVESIRAEAGKHGIHVFPGFELASKEGIHVLCLYPVETSTEQLGRFLGEFGIRDTMASSGPCNEDFSEVLARVRDQRGITIAPRVKSSDLYRNHIDTSRQDMWG